jgi:regulation of enolase protein 1 (concanavalin A-like superfamily)
MTTRDEVTIAAMPMPLRWLRPPRAWRTAGSRLTIEADGRTDWFADPADPAELLSTAPALVGLAPGDDFVLGARVSVAFRSVFDAGALMLHVDDRRWAKLCFEYSPRNEPTIVSVVTHGSSDDANAFVVSGREVWLRIARIGPACAFHASSDGAFWELIRYFHLDAGAEPRVGFEAQSPTGEGCVVTFDEIRFEPRRLTDLRGGA